MRDIFLSKIDDIRKLSLENLISQLMNCNDYYKPGLHDNFFGTVPVWIWPRCLNFAARHPPFLSCNWKNSWHECPKTYGCRIGSLGPRISWGTSTRATNNFSIYTTKMERAGLRGQIQHQARHRGQIQTGTVPKKLSCKPGLNQWIMFIPSCFEMRDIDPYCNIG